MKNDLNIFLGLFLILCIFFSCGHMTEEKPHYVYPMNIGNRWIYSTEIIRTNFDPESMENEFGFSESSTAICQVNGFQILRDSIETVVLGTTEQTDQYQYISHHYYQSTNDGLFIIAYQSAGGAIVYPKNGQKARLKFKSLHFRNMIELSNFMQQAIPLRKTASDSIIFEIPPVQTLKYPLIEGSQWTYRYDFNPWRIDKTVVGKTTIYLDMGAFECYHIKWLYDWDQNNEWDEDFWIDDYIGDEGLLKRKVSIIGTIFTDEHGNDIGSCDTFMEYTLTDIYF